MLFRCDKQCSEKLLSDWQLASVVVHGGDEAYTTNLYQKCLDKSLQAKGFSGCMGQCASTHLLKKEPRVLSELVRVGPSISAEKMKACALIVMAEENACRSDSGSSVSSRGSCDGNVGNDALHIIGPHGSADFPLLSRLGSGEGSIQPPHSPTQVCQEMHEVERRRGWFGF